MPENPASYRVVRTKSYLFNKAYVRYRECLLHARHMGVNKFIIIDDESHRFPPGCENLVSTNYSEGMTDQTVASVIMKYCQYLT
ncbi:TPA: hypothetical protein MH025_29830 [Klebsiella pneumoniae subsp. pneumoniae]|nr:hypothetical protein [Klebsiella pneumoniae subsp. pneumoniae]